MTKPEICIHGGLRRQCETCDLSDALAAKTAECERLREDAERYRWLKENTVLREQKENMRFVWEFPNWLTRSGDYPYIRNDSIDAAIDAARKETP